MKTLLVVEDEKMIRRGICTIAKRSGVEIEEILECSNGEEALELVKSRHIDVMFTDIRMPKMDGIELVQHIQNLLDKPLVVAISGYDDFSYAVEMLRNGVKEYILKPVDRDKISEVLHKLDEEISTANANEKNDIEIGKQQIRYLITNEPSGEDDIQALKNKFDELFFKDKYVVVCTSAREDISVTAERIVELSDVGDHNVYIFEEENLDEFIDTELAGSIAGISDKHIGIEGLRDAYKQATIARKRAFCANKTVCYSDELPRVAESLINQAQRLLDEQDMSQRLQLIGTGKTEELIRQWERLFSAVERRQLKEEYFEAGQERFIEDAIRTYRTSMTEEQYEALQDFRHMLSYCSIVDYKDCFMNWLLNLHESINSQEDDSMNDQKMKKAISYIHENYNADINMAVVSNYVSMNYSLFSFSFKQYTGTNFVNYLKALRVAEAKKMLEETDMKIIEISQCVGYDNEKHFMKLFKAYCGVSPTEYRKNMQRSK